MWTYIFSDIAEKQFGRLDSTIQQRLIKKLDYFCSSKQPLGYAKKISNLDLGEWRFRIGDWRIVFDVDQEGKLIIIALVGHRREIYK